MESGMQLGACVALKRRISAGQAAPEAAEAMEHIGAGSRVRQRACAAASGPLWAHTRLPEVRCSAVVTGTAERGACLQHSDRAGVPQPMRYSACLSHWLPVLYIDGPAGDKRDAANAAHQEQVTRD